MNNKAHILRYKEPIIENKNKTKKKKKNSNNNYAVGTNQGRETNPYKNTTAY